MAPGRRTGGRKRGTPNELSIGCMKAQVAAAVPALDALDALDQLRLVAKTFQDLIEAELAKPNPSRDYLFACYDRLARILEKIARYERPKLQAITLAGDARHPLRVQPDLSVLTDAELDALAPRCPELESKTGNIERRGSSISDSLEGASEAPHLTGQLTFRACNRARN
jgi:hypothetical protein